MKRKVLSTLLALMIAITTVGCGSTPSNKTKEEVQVPDTEEVQSETETKSDVTLTVAIWDKNQEPGLRQIMDDFTAQTGIKCDIQITPWKDYWTMLEAATTGGNMPDVFWMHAFQVSTYAQYEDVLLNLSDKIASSDKVDLSKYPEDIVKVYQNADGKQVGIPKDVDSSAVWYNKKMFDDAKIPYPTADWTWEDFREISKKLTKEDGSQFGLAMKPGSDQESWYSAIYAYGGKIISDDMKTSGFDDPNTLTGMKIIEGIIQDGSMPPYAIQAENETVALQEAGTVAMTFQGSWMASELGVNDYLKENIGIAPLPKGPEGTCSMYNGLAWSASAMGDHTEEAWKLVEYLGSKEAQEKQAELGVTLSALEGASAAWANSVEGFDLSPYLDVMEGAVLYPHSKNTTVWYSMMKEKLVSAWDGTRSMEEVCKEIAADMNQMLSEEE
ncbi:MAG: sugar ABC transporter substrate-binding protein [Mobilitalea sp.]